MRTIFFVILSSLLLVSCSKSADPDNTNINQLSWDEIVKQADGQTVTFNAWGGSNSINDYISWAGIYLKDEYNITLNHVKVNDIATSVGSILAEFTAGKRSSSGSVDLMWINGENFRSMKENNLLLAPYLNKLPNNEFLNPDDPAIQYDFGTPTEGYEVPWGSAQLVIAYNTDRVSEPPSSITELINYAEANPGRVTYPKPPNYIGTTFLKQLLYEVADNQQQLTQPVNDQLFESLAARLWTLIDRLHAVSWNSGTSFPTNSTDLFRLLNDKEVDFAFSFSPGETSAFINEGKLPQSTRTYIFTNGTIGNTHFVAIPANAPSAAAALVTANFLLSPQAQLRKQDPNYWGDFTVLDIARISDEFKQAFANLPFGIATLRPEQLQPTLPEPHASWVEKIEKAWQERYL